MKGFFLLIWCRSDFLAVFYPCRLFRYEVHKKHYTTMKQKVFLVPAVPSAFTSWAGGLLNETRPPRCRLRAPYKPKFNPMHFAHFSYFRPNP